LIKKANHPCGRASQEILLYASRKNEARTSELRYLSKSGERNFLTMGATRQLIRVQ